MQDSPESDPYYSALYFSEGNRLIIRNRLQFLLETLNPRDYVDWSGDDVDLQRRFYDSKSSYDSEDDYTQEVETTTTAIVNE